MIVVVHVHTDFKFINSSDQFIGKEFENHIIIIENKRPYEGELKENFTVFNIKDKQSVLNHCIKADLVVLYNLDIFKSSIAVKLPKNIKIAWRFFGMEIYGRNKNLYLSNQTRKYIFINSIKVQLKKYFGWPYYLYKTGFFSANQVFLEAIKRIDFMFILSKEEYNHLAKKWQLPKYIQFPVKSRLAQDDAPCLFANKNQLNTVIIGNNKSHYNNHLDIIDIVEKVPESVNYKFLMLMNYGQNDKYTQAIKKRIKYKTHYQLIESFIPSNEFDQFYKPINALVINGYRQMAAANIFTAFQSGVKVYLNPKNIFMNWMQDIGFKVYTIDDLKTDLKNGNLTLSVDEIQYNFDVLKRFSLENGKNHFQEYLIKSISENK